MIVFEGGEKERKRNIYSVVVYDRAKMNKSFYQLLFKFLSECNARMCSCNVLDLPGFLLL